MKYIDFSVCGKKIECARAGIVADNTDYIARLSLSAEWRDFSDDREMIIVDGGGKLYRIKFADKATEAAFPVFTAPTQLVIGLAASSGDDRLATVTVSLDVRPSIGTAASGAVAAPENNTKNMFAEFDALLDELETTISQMRDGDEVAYG